MSKSLKITKKNYDKTFGFTRLELNMSGSDINSTIVNTLRRMIFSEIPIYAFKKDGINIKTNTSVFNNSVLKLHIENIPVLGIDNNVDEYVKDETSETELFEDTQSSVEDDLDFSNETNVNASSVNSFYMYVNHTNGSNEIYSVTTDDAKFHYKGKNIKSPYKNPYTLVDLQPSQQIIFSAQAQLGIELEHTIFSPVSVCFFIKNNDDNYDFILESKGQLTEQKIISLACNLIIKKLHNFLKNIPKNNKMEGTIIVNNEEHTLGNLISRGMQESSSVNFFGYNVPHPLIKVVEFDYKLKSGNLNNILKDVVSKYEKIFENIAKQVDKLKL